MISDMERYQIDRINELARKKKTVGLSDLELEEQMQLRKMYIDDIRSQVTASLESFYSGQSDSLNGSSE